MKPQTVSQKLADNQRRQLRTNAALAGGLSFGSWLTSLQTRRSLQAAARKLRGEVAHEMVEARNANKQAILDKLVAERQAAKLIIRNDALIAKKAAEGLAGAVAPKRKKKGSRP